MIPLRSEFKAADAILPEIYKVLNATKNISKLLFEEGDDGIRKDLQDIWDVTKNTFISDERLRNALPSSILDVPRAAVHGTP